jgi:branched-chain amino acid aminotransferase
MQDVAFLNGQFLPLVEAKIPVTDYGFLFAYALYETVRTYNGRFFRLDDHLRRLEKSAQLLSIPVNISELKEKAVETVKRSEYPEARVRATVTLGSGTPSPDSSSCREPAVLITATKFTPQPVEVYEKGYKVVISDLTRNSRSLLPGMKTSTFVESMFVRRQARLRGADDAFLMNEQGFLTESSFANAFLVKDNVTRTPRLGGGFLPGITRSVVLELAAKKGLRLDETDISAEDLLSADEIFLANSLIEIMPVTGIEGKAVGAGKSGLITRLLMDSYKEQVKMETA